MLPSRVMTKSLPISLSLSVSLNTHTAIKLSFSLSFPSKPPRTDLHVRQKSIKKQTKPIKQNQTKFMKFDITQHKNNNQIDGLSQCIFVSDAQKVATNIKKQIGFFFFFFFFLSLSIF
jgi:hypothetical protein